MGKVKKTTKNKRSPSKSTVLPTVKKEILSDEEEELEYGSEEEIGNGETTYNEHNFVPELPAVKEELLSDEEELLSDEEEEKLYDDSGVPKEFSTGKVSQAKKSKQNARKKIKTESPDIKEEILSEDQEDDEDDIPSAKGKKRKKPIKKLVAFQKVKEEHTSNEEEEMSDDDEDIEQSSGRGKPRRASKRIVRKLVQLRSVKEELSDEDGISSDNVDDVDYEYEPPTRKAKRTNSPRKITTLPTLEKEEVMMDDDDEETMDYEDMENDAGYEPAEYNQEMTIETIMEQLQSVETDDKLCGLQVLATAFTEEESIEKLIEKKVIKIVTPFLLDQNSEIRHFAAGALRNLSACGFVDVCEHLVREDIMVPLIKLIQQFGDCKPGPKPEKENENTDTFVQAVNLLWNLCELDETAVQYFNSAQLLNVLISCLDIEVFGLDLAVVISQCLHTVSEDNAEAISALKNYETQLLSVLAVEKDSTKMLVLKANIAGLIVTCNLFPNGLLPLITTLSQTLNADSRKKLCDLSSQIPVKKNSEEVSDKKNSDEATDGKNSDEVPNEKNAKEVPVEKATEEVPVEKATEEVPVEKATEEVPVEKDTEPLDKATEAFIEECEDLLLAQITALEILANICSSQDDEKGQNMDDPLNDEMEQDEEGWKDADETQPIVLTPELHEALMKFKILESTYQNTNLPPDNVCNILNNFKETKGIMKKVYRTRSRAFLCYSNLVTVLDIEDLGGADSLYSTWIGIGKLIQDKDEIDKEEFLEAATSAMRAIVLRLAGINYPNLGTLSTDYEDILQVLLHIGIDGTDPLVRGNIVRILGTLGALFGNNSDGLDMTMAIGIFLLGIVEKETDLWLMSETLDAIMDVFAEDSTDLAAHKIGLVNQLKVLAALLNRKIRQQHTKQPDKFSVVSTAAMNLGRFITYKGERLDKIKVEVS